MVRAITVESFYTDPLLVRIIFHPFNKYCQIGRFDHRTRPIHIKNKCSWHTGCRRIDRMYGYDPSGQDLPRRVLLVVKV